METKHITIREEQAEWVRENSLNLSRFVQRKLDELMQIFQKGITVQLSPNLLEAFEAFGKEGEPISDFINREILTFWGGIL